jgi:hypothetical protein
MLNMQIIISFGTSNGCGEGFLFKFVRWVGRPLSTRGQEAKFGYMLKR